MMNLIGKIKKYKKIKNRVYKEEKKGFFFLLYKEERIRKGKIEKNTSPPLVEYTITQNFNQYK
jgi:hypothetical protein